MTVAGRRGGASGGYDSEAEKFADQKTASTLLAVIRGARDPEWAEALAAAEGATENPRKQVVAAAYSKAAELRDGEPTTSSGATSEGGQA